MTSTVLRAALWIAALLPGLIALNLPPSPTLFNQAAAWAAWALVATYGVRSASLPFAEARDRTRSLTLALVMVSAAAVGSWAFGHLPMGLALSPALTLLAAAALVMLGASMAPTPGVFAAWATAWAAAALVNALVACVQVFAPHWVDGDWIARTEALGRALGNVRQPNHLASLLLMGAAALPAVLDAGAPARAPARRVLAFAAMAVLMLATMATGSRTGMVGTLVLAAWGAWDRRLSRSARALLLAAPVLFALAWWLVGLWSEAQVGHAIGAAQRIGQAEVTSGRFTVWSNSLALIAAQPLAGTGFGEFNLAWTLTPMPARWPQFFDHTHNLPLQLLVELGLPLGGAVLALLTWALWQAGRRAWSVQGSSGAAARAAFMMVLLMGLHSQLEYPLWYAHFLLPTAFAWGLCLGCGTTPARRESPALRWPLAIGLALAVGSAAMLWDYQRVTSIFAPPDDGTSLEQRIADGQRSWLFAHHADYARITALEDAAPPTPADFARSSHFLLDTRLLTAWAKAYAREGDVERARWIADRLRELRQDSAAPFFAPCSDPAVAARPFQCTPASRSFSWRDFK